MLARIKSANLKCKIKKRFVVRKDQKFKLSHECQQVFESLKQRLMSAPVLVMANPNKSFLIKCDASGIALGAELRQLDDQQHSHPIAYASRQLSDTERKKKRHLPLCGRCNISKCMYTTKKLLFQLIISRSRRTSILVVQMVV